MLRSYQKLALWWLFSLFAASECAPAEVFSSKPALVVAASHTSALHAPTGTHALPLPPNFQNEPAYEVVAKLVAGWPIVQQVQSTTMPTPEPEEASSLMLERDISGPEEKQLSGRASAMRVMIVGDSITQGQQGDFTWRYRMWQWFQQQGISFLFVGPYTGTFQSTTALATGAASPPAPPPLYGSSATSSNDSAGSISVNGGYARTVNSAFLQAGGYNHFANWGRAMATDQSKIAGMLQNTPADVILLALGFNDLGWFYSDCYGLINSLQLFIQNARSVNPNIKILIANVPQRTFIRPDLVSNTTTYNNILPSYISKWSTAQSPLHLVEFEQNYACGTTSCPAAYDGLHPNSWGEYQIAQAFSKSLIAGFGIGSTPLAIPGQNDASVIRQIDTPTNFKVFSSPQGVSATWDPVYGAYSYNVTVSINGGASSSSSVAVNRWDSTWPLAGWTYTVTVSAACGNQQGGSTSTLTATANPQLAPPPNNVNVKPISDGFTVTWTPPTGPYTDSIIEYNVIYWDTEPTDCQFITGAAFTSSPATIHGLIPGRNYLVAPLTWNGNGQGLPVGARNVVPGSTNTPSTPANFNVISNDPTTVHITWNSVAGAAGYEVFARNKTGGPYLSLANVTQSCNDEYFLYPGTWNYQFCVAAWNGNLESPQGPGVIAPSPASTVTAGSPGPTCAAAPSWCPGYGLPYTGPSVGGCAGCGGGGGSSVPTASTTSTSSTPPPTSSCTTRKTAISGTPYAVCGTSTTRDPSPSPYSFQAQFTGNIAYGNIVPTDVVSAIAKTCTGGCNGGVSTTTTTGILLSSTTAYQAAATLYVPYVVTDQQVPDQDYQYFTQALMSIVKSVQTSVTFDWTSCNYVFLPNGQSQCNPQDNGMQTQWHGPSYVQGVRWQLGATGLYNVEAGTFGFAVSSYTQQQKVSCSDIEGPLAAALGAIPGIGPVFGLIGSTICSTFNVANGS